MFSCRTIYANSETKLINKFQYTVKAFKYPHAYLKIFHSQKFNYVTPKIICSKNTHANRIFNAGIEVEI